MIFAKPVTPADVIKTRATQGTRPLIAAIKDITTAFYKRANDAQELWDSVVTPEDKQTGGSPDPNDASKINQEKIDDIRPDGLDETTASMKYARKHRMLVDVGPSFTTGRAMQLGSAIGADDLELMCVALGFFAFWNREYWRGTSGIHHFHFVMDMLDNYAPGSYPYAGTRTASRPSALSVSCAVSPVPRSAVVMPTTCSASPARSPGPARRPRPPRPAAGRCRHTASRPARPAASAASRRRR